MRKLGLCDLIFPAATSPFPKSCASQFRFARFNTFPLYYLRAWHRLFCGQLQTPSQSLLGKYVFFAIQLSHFRFMYLPYPTFKQVIDPFFTYTYNTNILVRLPTVNMKNCLTPNNPKMCDLILVTLLKMRPRYSQSSRENETPSSGTSPLAPYQEVPPHPGHFSRIVTKYRDPALVFPACKANHHTPTPGGDST